MSTGKLNLIIGPMYSGKTSELIRRYRRYNIGGKKCLLIKYFEDDRYNKNKVVTHDNLKCEAINTNELSQLDDQVKKYDVICIDEIQFYPDSAFFCDKWANQGLIIEACGLNGDFNRMPFEQISLLIPKVDNLLHLTAIDKQNGKEAPFTIRLTNDKQQKVIGGYDIYNVVSRENLK